MDALRQQLRKFVCYELTPVDSIFEMYGTESIVAEIQSILENDDNESVSHTLSFIRDAGLFEHPFREAFRDHIKHSQIWPVFSKMLIGPNFWVRKNTICTIAKLSFPERASLLTDALPFYIENDPINLPNLLAERNWLGIPPGWDLVERLAQNPNFSVRWSLCALLYHFETSGTVSSQLLQILEKLRSDPNPRVSAEAAFRYERVKIKAGPKLPKPEWRENVKRIAALEPKATFERVEMEFIRNRSNYTIAEFERFAVETDPVMEPSE